MQTVDFLELDVQCLTCRKGSASRPSLPRHTSVGIGVEFQDLGVLRFFRERFRKVNAIVGVHLAVCRFGAFTEVEISAWLQGSAFTGSSHLTPFLLSP